jgi:2-hydroxy-6-oxonona-2,4-dienedioate hydrolase
MQTAPLDTQRANAPTSVWTTVNGLRIHARVAGECSETDLLPVILVHGLGVTGRYFVPTQVHLARKFRVYVPDLPGFGRSDAPSHALDVPELADALAAWMEACGITRAALVGNSMGCQIIADLAVRRPELVDRVVMNAPTMDPHARNGFRQFIRLMLDTPREHPAQTLIVLYDYLDTGPIRTAQMFRHALRDPIETKLPHMSMPVMIVRGARDPIVSQRWVEEAVDLLPNGCLRVLPGSPHASNFTTPLQFTRVIQPFLLGQTSGASSQSYGLTSSASLGGEATASAASSTRSRNI